MVIQSTNPQIFKSTNIRVYKLAICICIYLLTCSFAAPPVWAQSCDSSCANAIECRDKIAKCQEAWDQMEAAKKPHVDALHKMEADILAFQSQIKNIAVNVAKKAVGIAEGEKELNTYLTVAQARIRRFFIRSFTASPLVGLFSSTNVGTMLRMYAYNKAITNEDKKEIAKTAVSVKDLEDRKAALEKEQASLAYIKAETDKRAVSVRKLVADADAYQSRLTGIIASLTAQQQALLSARSGVFTTSVGDVPLADDPNARPNYNPGYSPAFAGFSFGAYTHRKGMSQYGAKGRAMSGQNYQDILRAYYGKNTENTDTGGSINVSGVGSVDFENYYLYGIAEMPADFPFDALKAQAIAARSYALSAKRSGQSICTTQSCQVFLSSKANNPPEAWKRAVQDTRGQVITGVTTYYSSTTGGYSTTGGWDTKCGNQGCWTGDAYEKIAGSPWFYKGWYTSDYSNNSGKCGRSSPWLTEDEFADILNAWQVRKNGGDASRVLPITINSCSVGGAGGNPYSMSEMRDVANAHGGAFSSVSSISVSYNGGGYTDSVHIITDKGTVDISGSEFKETFNLRAPGYISIRSPLFNIEKK
jgi:hypothetical protein